MNAGFEIRVVRVKSDSPHVAFLSSLNRLDDGVVALRTRPAAHRVGWLIRDLLAAMGKRHDVSGRGRNDQENLALVPVWMLAHEVTDVIVAGAESLQADHLADLIDIAAATRVRLWLVCDLELGAGVTELAESWPMIPVDQATFDGHWSTTSSATTGLEPESSWPEDVPFADFPVYLAEVRRLVDPQSAEQVEAHYWQELQAATAQFREAEPTEESLGGYLRACLGRCPHRTAMITTLRATQAAAFNAGWFVQVDMARLLASGAVDISAVVNNRDTWRRLRAYRQPYRAAVCALTAAHLDIATQRRLRVGDVAPDGHTVLVDGRRVEVPRDAAVFLRAQRTWRRISGATADDLLLTSSTDKPVGARRLRQALDDAASQLGIVLTYGKAIATREPNHRWRGRVGVSIQQLSEEAS